ncbi:MULTISPECIES: hypothetical protein [Aquimarina]|nr:MULTISPECIES: hypothetical protein [Aquimarina]
MKILKLNEVKILSKIAQKSIIAGRINNCKQILCAGLSARECAEICRNPY